MYTAFPCSEYYGVLRLLREHSQSFGTRLSVTEYAVSATPGALPSSGPFRFPPCHALRLRRGLRSTRRSALLLVAFPVFRPGRPSDYTLTKLNHLTPRGYGLVVALFTLSPESHEAGPKTRFSAEGSSLRRPEFHRLETVSFLGAPKLKI